MGQRKNLQFSKTSTWRPTLIKSFWEPNFVQNSRPSEKRRHRDFCSRDICQFSDSEHYCSKTCGECKTEERSGFALGNIHGSRCPKQVERVMTCEQESQLIKYRKFKNLRNKNFIYFIYKFYIFYFIIKSWNIESHEICNNF